MFRLNCKDYYIIKMRYYADKKLLDKYWEDNHTIPPQHYERCADYMDFRWLLVNEICGKDSMYWHTHYMIDSVECAKEYICEKYNIYFKTDDGDEILFIPKSNEKIFEWVKDNIPSNIPNKILKKTRNYFNNSKNRVREHSREFTLKSPYYKHIMRTKKLERLL